MTDHELEPTPLAEWEDPRVQLVYQLLCSDEVPANEEDHWEGWMARRIIAELELESQRITPPQSRP